MDQMISSEDQPRFVVCLRNDGWPMDLQVRKVYRVLSDEPGARSGWIRIIDDTDEDYLYPAEYFHPLDLPDEIAERWTGEPSLRVSPSSEHRFAVCVCNDGFPAALELQKVYLMLPDPHGARHGLVRIVDESGEAYLYPEEYFHPVDLSPAAREGMLRAS